MIVRSSISGGDERGFVFAGYIGGDCSGPGGTLGLLCWRCCGGNLLLADPARNRDAAFAQHPGEVPGGIFCRIVDAEPQVSRV